MLHKMDIKQKRLIIKESQTLWIHKDYYNYYLTLILNENGNVCVSLPQQAAVFVSEE